MLSVLLFLFSGSSTGTSRSAHAQPFLFGSADDPAEQLKMVWWRRESSLDAMGGLSLIGPQWRAATALRMNVVTRPLTAHLDATIRAGYYGEYRPDVDEWYDALRTIQFARYTTPESPLYVRVGPIERMRLGTGHIVNFFNSSVAWDDRTVGAETFLQTPFVDVGVFTDNLLLDGVTGGYAALHPLRPSAAPSLLSSFRVGVGAVTDLNTWSRPGSTERLSAYNVDAQFALVQAGSVHLSPFASYASYLHHGSGVGVGIDAHSQNFIDLARFRLRLALYYNDRAFVPGYFGAFYPVSNPSSRILDSQQLTQLQPSEYTTTEADYEDVLLGNARGGNDFVTELRLLIFDNFEFWYFFRRHYGSQNLSTFHLRLFLRATSRFRLVAGQDRGRLGSFFSLFNSLNDQTALVFKAEYQLRPGFWTHVRSRYTYEKIDETEKGNALYLVQRRFEPFVGFRFRF